MCTRSNTEIIKWYNGTRVFLCKDVDVHMTMTLPVTHLSQQALGSREVNLLVYNTYNKIHTRMCLMHMSNKLMYIMLSK